MRFGINTIDEFDVKGKTVLLRVDINQPVDRATGTLRDTTRIQACVPTIRELSDRGAKLVLLAHQGSDIEYKNFYTTEPHAAVLRELLERPVRFLDDVCGPAAREAIRGLEDGEILLLDNVRFVSEEQTLFELKLKLTHEQQAQTLLVRKLAPLADLYVMDAFAAAHRDQPSLCGFEQVLPSAMGRLFEEEYCVISGLMQAPERPCVFVLGGAKIADAFLMMDTVLERGIADRVLTGGLAGQILLAAAGEDIGAATMDYIVKSNYADYIGEGKKLLSAHADKLVMPSDLAYISGGERHEIELRDTGSCEALKTCAAVDIGPKTIEQYCEIIRGAKTVFCNGPVGVFEQSLSEDGTRALFEALGETAAYTVVGGGDSITAAKKYHVDSKLDYICTGGGALIRFLSGEELPVVRALRHAAQAFPAGGRS
ncbi:phosphoglycerate kinase [Feifania hominis]|uniref:Phosphoglycerate kinase n=1 Tax=Feifania hominis TaxID=2763660 RepID=A0A926HU77_9FIRM|nr:phosphoglycerate kinase [Feifania hominis]MBC8535655.1 phosphoglycerate kinase [Feifania hominis]